MPPIAQILKIARCSSLATYPPTHRVPVCLCAGVPVCLCACVPVCLCTCVPDGIDGNPLPLMAIIAIIDGNDGTGLPSLMATRCQHCHK